MNIFAEFQQRLIEGLRALEQEGKLPGGLDYGRVVVEPTRDSAHGDLAANAAMVLAKDAGMKPRDLAEVIAGKLAAEPGVAQVAIAGPGFINITLTPAVFHGVIAGAIASGPAFGKSSAGADEPINVEYVSANPTGPMHVGHCRGAVFGDALANLLDFAGWKVTREYYINDAGAQVDVLARSAYLRYREALGEAIVIPEGLYPGEYLKPVGETLAREHGHSLINMLEECWLPMVRRAAIEAMMEMIKSDLKVLNIEHEVFFSELSLQLPVDYVAETIADLRARGIVYEGRLDPPKGQPIEDWEDREQTLFRATDFGDDVDRPLLKSDGSYTYFASDIAYHRNKYLRGFKEMIDVWGADHGGYVKRMSASVRAVSANEGHLDVKLCQLVKLMRDGEPVKMSKRSGDFVTLREVVDEVGRDAVRFMMLYRKNDASLDFDLAKVVEQSKDNPVFYVQYAHARCASAFRKAAETFPGRSFAPAELGSADLALLSDESEVGLMRRIAQYPRIIDSAASSHEPHRLAFYLYELASELNAHWTRGGKDQTHLRFVNDTDPDLTSARLALVYSLMCVLRSGLAVLGVNAPDEMR